MSVLNVDSIPKAEIHLHLEGAAPPDLVAKLAAQKGVDLKGLVRDGRYQWRGFSEFLAAYDAAAAVFTTPEDYEALTRSILEGLAAQNVIYAEFFVSPDHAAATGVAWEDYLAAVVDKIAGEIQKIMQTDAFRKKAAEQGAEAEFMGPKTLGAYTQSELERWGKVVKAAGIKAN